MTARPFPSGAAAQISMELGAWFLLPVMFLYFYVNHGLAPASSIAPHLLIVALAVAMFFVIRVALACIAPARHWVDRGFATVVYAVVLLLELLYYPLVIAGLKSWGQVISWDLIKSYAPQLPSLALALDVPFWETLMGLGSLMAVIVWCIWRLCGRFDWPQRIAECILSPPMRGRGGLLLCGGFCLCAVKMSLIFYFADTRTGEPIVKTLFPSRESSWFHGFQTGKSAHHEFDGEHDAARASYQPGKLSTPKNLVLIVVDALRPDHLSFYGYGRRTTPHLDLLAVSPRVHARRVDNMRAICSLSICGLFGIASSRYVHQASSRPFTLQQVLRLHGYQVRMILGGDHTNFYGLRSLYGEIDSYIDGSDPSAKYMNSDEWVIEKTAELPSWNGRPVMLQFHLMSAHPLSARPVEFARFKPATSYGVQQFGKTPEIRNVVNFYDNGVLQADYRIHQLVKLLRDKKYLDNALVVITADHGDALGEHGQFSHGRGVREAGIRIPFILLSFGYTPPALSATHPVTSQVDIGPTLLTELGMPIPPVWHGKALQFDQPRDFIFVQQGDESGLFDLRHPPSVWKYWLKTSTWQEFAFNLKTDPGEYKEALNSTRGIAHNLRAEWRGLARKVLNGKDAQQDARQ